MTEGFPCLPVPIYNHAFFPPNSPFLHVIPHFQSPSLSVPIHITFAHSFGYSFSLHSLYSQIISVYFFWPLQSHPLPLQTAHELSWLTMCPSRWPHVLFENITFLLLSLFNFCRSSDVQVSLHYIKSRHYYSIIVKDFHHQTVLYFTSNCDIFSGPPSVILPTLLSAEEISEDWWEEAGDPEASGVVARRPSLDIFATSHGKSTDSPPAVWNK